MQTAHILTPASVNSGSNSAARPAETSAPETPFNQVLSREVADRSRSPAASGTGDSNAAADKQTAPPASRTADARSADARKTPDEPAAANGEMTQEERDAAAAASADMLILVAGLGQTAGNEAEAAATVSAETAQDSRLGVATDALEATTTIDPRAAQAAAGKPDAEAKALLQTAASGQPVDSAANAAAKSGSKTDAAFAAMLEKGGAVQPGEARSASDRKATAALDPATRPLDTLGAGAGRAAASAAHAAAQAADSLPGMPSASAAGIQQAQHAAMNTAQAVAPQAQDRLSPPVGSPAWDQALGQKVVWMVAGEQQSASLTLNPPDLGPLKVVLNVTNSQANATFVSAQPEVRQALEAALPRLREMLGEAGIQLGQASVNSGSASPQDTQGERQAQGGRGIGAIDTADSDNDAQLQTSRMPTPARGQGLVDTFA